MNRDLVFLALALLTWGTGEGMFLNFQPLYLETLGANPRVIGGILGTIGLAMTISYLPAGYLSDRFGRRPLLYAAWFLGAIAAWVMALADSLPVFVFGEVFYGFTSFVLVPLNSYVTMARGRLSVGRAITLISASFNLGAVLGPLLGGWIGETFGMRNTFLAAAIIFSISSILILFIRSQPVETHESQMSLHAFKNVLNPRFIRYLLVILFVMFSLYLPQPLSPNFLQNVRGLNLIQIGQLLSLTSIGVVVLNLWLGQMNARKGFLLAQLAMASFALFIWRGTSMVFFIPAYLLLGSYRTARSLAVAQGQTLAKSHQMGIAYGWIETMTSTAIILAPPLAGIIYSLSPGLMYPVSLVLIALAILLTVFINPIKPEDVV